VSARPQREARQPRDEVSPREEARSHPEGPPPERTVLSATEARQGEIILGRYGIWVWIGSFAAILLLVLVLSFWP
jgi:hypothetical protein